MMVSMETRPALAHDTELSIAEMRQFYDRVNRANVMIKIPAALCFHPAGQSLPQHVRVTHL